MARYKISLYFEGSNIKSVEKKVREMFGEDAAAQVVKLGNGSSRADRYVQAESDFDTVKEEVEMLKTELEEWKDNLPENLQDGMKADELQTAIDELDDIHSELDGISWPSVEFPGMF